MHSEVLRIVEGKMDASRTIEETRSSSSRNRSLHPIRRLTVVPCSYWKVIWTLHRYKPSCHHTVNHITREVWLELYKLFDGTSADKSYNLCMSFFGFMRNPEDDISTHMCKLKNIGTELTQDLQKDKKEWYTNSYWSVKYLKDSARTMYASFKSSWLLVPKVEWTIECLTRRIWKELNMRSRCLNYARMWRRTRVDS